MAALFEKYRGGAFAEVVLQIRIDYGTFERSVDFAASVDRQLKRWPRDMAAAFALEAATAIVDVNGNWAGQLIEDAATQLKRTSQADGFECAWYLAVAAFTNGPAYAAFGGPTETTVSLRRPELDRVLAQGESRCADTDGVALGHAVNREVSFEVWLNTRGAASRGGSGRPSPPPDYRAALDDAAKTYQRLLASLEFGAEARLRLGHVRYRQGRVTEALDLWRQRSDNADSAYLSSLFSGMALSDSEKWDQARVEYESAVKMRPTSQPARFSLATTLYIQGHREAAEELLAGILAAPPSVADDPWWKYFSPGTPELPRRLAALRADLR